MEGIFVFPRNERGSGENGSAVELRLGSAARLSLLPAEESSAGMGPRTGLDKKGKMRPGT